MKSRYYYVYILTTKRNTVLYTGVTNNLIRRMGEHRRRVGSKFTRRYNVNKLVYFESDTSIRAAIRREKQLKAGSRQRKVDLINSLNPEWCDLYDDLFD